MTETPPAVDYIAQANMIHENGPAVTPPSTLYFHFLKPAWEDQPEETIVSKATNAEQYLRLGYTITGEETIENFAEWNEQQATKAAPASKTAPRGEHAEAPEHKAKS